MRSHRRLFPIVAAASLLIGFATAGWSAPDGKALYGTKCAMCHGADGTAGAMWAKKGAPNFNDAAWQKAKSDDAIVKSVVDGNPAKMMPSYKGKLTDEEIRAIVKHLRSLAPVK